MEDRIAWRRYGGLEVGIVARPDLLCLKLDAAVGATGPQDKHFADLIKMRPTPAELSHAEAWVRQQDAGPDFPDTLTRVLSNVRRALGQTGT
jgi:hypothetical protein